MPFKKTFFIFLLSLTSSLLASNLPKSEIWFSEKKEFRNGFEFLQISLQENKFILAKLSYNSNRKWEETRILGVLQDDGDKIKLKPEMCAIYAAKQLGLRWVLIQGFDCDHLDIQMTKNEQGIFISPSVGITETLLLKKELDNSENMIPAILVLEEENKFYAWSLKMRYVKKNSIAFLHGKPIKTMEIVDSTGTFEIKDTAKVGDRIAIKNQQAGLFD